MKLFATFTKAEEQSDGTLMVEGIASTETVDAQGEIVKSSAMEAALPDYMRHGTGALREMHQPLAAGTAMASVADGVTTIKAHVVDPVAVKKVTAGVYKGFSIGGKVTERDSNDKNTITGLKLVEISLVDRPANPDACLTMWKAEELDEEPVAKSFWDVAALASILADLKSLQSCAAWDAAFEGEASETAAQLKSAVGTLAEILVGMVKEEVAEDGMEASEVVIEAAEPVVDLAKAGPEDTDHGGEGADETAIVAEPAAKVEEPDLTKVEDMIAKAVAAAVEPLAKANTDLLAEVEKLKAIPAPKGAIMAVGKGEELGGAKPEEVEPVRKADGSIDDIATEMKKVHRAGAI
jgi:hypothetical protein